ncbi:aspartyl protease family protein At5g10770-like [Tasmannia lanceolata]|uniref:aspartyl protease family protein At5g10770-like n=1 Tax=Tasmannia lanceolata TaxID=3420 RepID=UPI0040637420
MPANLYFFFPYLLFSSFVWDCSGADFGGGSENLYVKLGSLLPTPVCSMPASTGYERSAAIRVVHRHGPCSSSSQPTKAAIQILLEDECRVNSLRSRISKRVLQGQTLLPAHDGRLVETGNYVVTIGFGTPKRDMTVVFDTGSDFTWIQCHPCAAYCYPQQDPIFDSSNSSSYLNVSCNSAECSQLKSTAGNAPGCSSSTCLYGIRYGDQSYSIGFFAHDTLTLTPSAVVPNFPFGCGQRNRGLFGKTAGVLGLGRGKLSLVSQTAQKFSRVFSYCLPSSPSSSTGFLKFGEEANYNSFKFTPLLTQPDAPSFYFLDMMGISVGGRKLGISPMVFSSAGTLIDSGTVITRLAPSAYSALRGAFRQYMSNYPSAEALSILDTCYDLTGYDTVTVPKITLQFRGGVDVNVKGILYGSSPSQICLAFAGNNAPDDVAIIGNKQQQTYQVVYDVARGRIGFGEAACT